MVEKYRKNVFCEWRFLEDYLSKTEDKTIAKDNIQKFMLYAYIKELLMSSYVNLFIDISGSDFESKVQDSCSRMRAAKTNPDIQLTNLDYLLVEMDQKVAESNWHLKCEGASFIHVQDLDAPDQPHLDSIYLSCMDANICDKVMKNLGILAVSPDNLSQLYSLINDNGVAIKKDDYGNWKSILKSKIPVCNASVIVDNYLLNDTKQLDDNLQVILDSILPSTLKQNVSFDLTIVTALKKDKKVDLPSQDRLDRIKSMLEKLRPDLKVKLTILKCESNIFHDRIIITNNLWVSCGGGFDLFQRRKATKTTTVNVICPFLSNSVLWSHDAYSNLIIAVRNLWGKKTPFISDSYPSFYIGDGVNRLVD